MNIEIPNKIEIPNNIVQYIYRNDGVNLSVNINSAATISGYGRMIFCTYVLSKITRTCHRCGYDPLWNPDDTESKCIRHTYDGYRYDEVFAYSPDDEGRSLEECFEEWLSKNNNPNKPAERMIFGRTGF